MYGGIQRVISLLVYGQVPETAQEWGWQGADDGGSPPQWRGTPQQVVAVGQVRDGGRVDNGRVGGAKLFVSVHFETSCGRIFFVCYYHLVLLIGVLKDLV